MIDIYTNIYNKPDNIGFLIVIFSWQSGEVPSLQSYGIYTSQFFLFARVGTSVFEFHFLNIQLIGWLMNQAFHVQQLRKTFL